MSNQDEDCQSCKETPEMKLADAEARIKELEQEVIDAYDRGQEDGYQDGYESGHWEAEQLYSEEKLGD